MSENKAEHIRAGLSQDEIDVLEADEAASASGAQASGEEAGSEAAAAAAAAGAEAGAVEGGEGAGDDAGAAEQAAGTTKPLGTFAPTLAATRLSDEETARLAAITTEKAGLLKKFYEGELSAEDYATQEDALATERATLLSKQNNAEFAATYNQQMQQNLMEHSRANFLQAATSLDGVDYTKPEIAAKFDRAFQILAADPEYSEKPLSELNSVYQAAHEMVKLQLGMPAKAAKDSPGAATVATAAATQAVTKPAAQAAAQPIKAPKTLAGMPPAAQAATGDADMDALANLDGDELMSKLASMPKATVERIMRKSS